MPTNQGKQYQNHTIVVPFEESDYSQTVDSAGLFRQYLLEVINTYPELFPANIKGGFQMKDIYRSIRLDLAIRRISVQGIPYTVRPSFVMPHLTGYVKDAEKAMFLRKFSVPFRALAYIFGYSAMHRYRMEHTIGRYSIVETTVNHPEDLPEHLAADEKHSWHNGDKVYLPTVCGKGCILGVSATEKADEASLTEGYGVFKAEAQNLNPEYQPETVNTDGWAAARSALQTLFPATVLILCFLHVYLGIRDRCKRKFQALFYATSDKLWHCYQAVTKAEFSQRLRRLYEWSQQAELPDFMRSKLDKLYQHADDFRVGYIAPSAHRTSNMVDRLMQRMDRHLTQMQYFHGTTLSMNLSIRGWALIQNFAPFNPYTEEQHMGWRSPAEALNQSRYHENWLQNLLISTSLVSKYRPPQNPL